MTLCRACAWNWTTALFRCSKGSWPPRIWTRDSRARTGPCWSGRCAEGRHGTQRFAGHQRKDFHRPGQAIARSAASDVRTLVIGNPCNTNALIAMRNARGVPAKLLRHDHARRKPGQNATGAEGECGCRRRQQPRRLGQSQFHHVPGFLQRPDQRAAAPDVISHVNGWRRFHHHRPAAGARRSSRPASVERRQRRKRRGGHRPPPHHPTCRAIGSALAVCADGSYDIEKASSARSRCAATDSTGVVQGVPLKW